MNSSAKAINQSNVFQGRLADMRLSKALRVLILLLCLLFLTALATIYITNVLRIRFTALQQLKEQADALQLEQAQLLLEQASFATPARVQALAIEHLHMVSPNEKSTYILNSK